MIFQSHCNSAPFRFLSQECEPCPVEIKCIWQVRRSWCCCRRHWTTWPRGIWCWWWQICFHPLVSPFPRTRALTSFCWVLVTLGRFTPVFCSTLILSGLYSGRHFDLFGVTRIANLGMISGILQWWKSLSYRKAKEKYRFWKSKVWLIQSSSKSAKKRQLQGMSAFTSILWWLIDETCARCFQ